MRRGSARQVQLLALLRAAGQERQDVPLAAFDEDQIHWAIVTGVGPLLVHITRADPQATLSPSWPVLRGTDLLARLVTSEQADALGEILAACDGHVPPVTLLKGISMRDQYYPAPHLRPMRDIDLLVAEEAIPIVEALLYQLGYHQQSQQPAAFYHTHHHSMPFVHPQRGVWVEVHRRLFPAHTRVGADRVFSDAHLSTQLRPAAWQGRPVTRLSAALQIVYIASHWACSFQGIGGAVAMLDLVYLLKHTSEEIPWAHILDWLDGSVAATYLYLLLTYLDTYHLITVAPEILQALFTKQRTFGTVNLKILHRLIDRYIVDGEAVRWGFNTGHLAIVWESLLVPGSPFGNLIRAPWNVFLAWVDSHIVTLPMSVPSLPS